MSPFLPDQEKLLLQQISDDNEEAFAQLFHAYRDKLFSFIYHITASRELSLDIVQDVFLKIWELRGKLFSIENFNAYLFRMAQNQAINQLQRMAKETLILKNTQKQNDGGSETPEGKLRFKNISEAIAKIVNELPPQQKAVYTLSREQNMKQEEIARQLKISISTVQNHMTQALKSLREGLKSYLNG
ncbi:MAG: RNA polymerase sigma factor [Chitinophagaceae bacterium]